MRFIFKFLVFCIVTAWFGCANPSMPQGGPRDVSPPKLDSLTSTPSPSTNFTDREISLTFDEWITLTDAFNQVVISPPMDKRPEIKLRKKTVTVTFDESEELKPNTTYIINFGNAIKDLTEGNVPPDMQFVFSTGPTLDSLSISGKVVDLATKQPAKDAYVLLYENLADSVIRTSRPYYFTKTDASGQFKFNYLKSDTFRIFGLVDNNYNYQFDLPNEKIAFQKDPIIITDSSKLSISLSLFEEDLPMSFVDYEDREYGKIRMEFNQPPSTVDVDVSEAFDQYYTEVVKDSIIIWYADTATLQERTIYISDKENLKDTVEFKIPPFKTKGELTPRDNRSTQEIHTKGYAKIEFERPIAKVDTSLLQVLVDSVPYLGEKILEVGSEERLLQITLAYQAEKKYILEFLPGCVTDIFGQTHDTLIQPVKVLGDEEFGEMNLKVLFPDSTIQYVLELRTPKDELLDKVVVESDTAFIQTYKTLPAGKYQLTIIEDINRNGKKDSGDYDKGLQPEKIFVKTLDELRKNWTLEAVVEPQFGGEAPKSETAPEPPKNGNRGIRGRGEGGGRK